MTDLRKAAEMALECLNYHWDYFEDESGDGLYVLEAKKALRQALAQPDLAKVGEVGVWGQETFTLDRGCYERGCVAYDERDGDGVTINVDANSGKFDSIGKRDSSSWVGLSDEERENFRKLGFVGVSAVENKLKEKNA